MKPPPPGDHELAQVTVAILAGGEGRRMGAPKNRLIARGKPMLRFLVEHLDWPGPTLLILGHDREAPPGSDAFGRIVRDDVAGQGPLRGILSALDASDAPAIIVLPVDMPWIGREQLAFIAASLAERPESGGVLLSRPAEGGPRIEPFPCILRRRVAPLILAQLERGEFAIRALADQPSISVVQAPGAWPTSTWNNLNSPGDLPEWIILDS